MTWQFCITLSDFKLVLNTFFSRLIKAVLVSFWHVPREFFINFYYPIIHQNSRDCTFKRISSWRISILYFLTSSISLPWAITRFTLMDIHLFCTFSPPRCIVISNNSFTFILLLWDFHFTSSATVFTGNTFSLLFFTWH